MKIKKLIIASLLSLLTVNAYAECSGRQCSNVDVDRLYIRESGKISVGTSGDEKLLNCANNNAVYLTMSSNAVAANHIYSLLLTAQTANKKVTIRIVENDPDCKIMYVVLDKQ